MKKLAALALVLLMALSLVACGSKKEWPSGDITIICPFAAGGAMDSSARLTAKYLKKQLGVEVTVSNVEGGGNWIGYGQVLDAKGDGYILGFSNYPGQVGGYLNPTNNITKTYRDFTNVADIVHDPGIIVVLPDSPYQTLNDLIEAGKKEKLVISTGGATGSDDDVLIRLINQKYGTQFEPGGNKGDSDAKTALFGKVVAAQACNVSNYAKTYKSTEADAVRVLAVFDSERSALMPDIPTAKELGIDLISSSDRGMVACKALDKDVLAKIVEALKAVEKDPEFQNEAKEQGMGIHMLFGEDFEKFIDGVESNMKGLNLFDKK
jgi:tripartite-type tricarboxylate transporter receptor subunit TctC